MIHRPRTTTHPSFYFHLHSNSVFTPVPFKKYVTLSFKHLKKRPVPQSLWSQVGGREGLEHWFGVKGIDISTVLTKKIQINRHFPFDIVETIISHFSFFLLLVLFPLSVLSLVTVNIDTRFTSGKEKGKQRSRVFPSSIVNRKDSNNTSNWIHYIDYTWRTQVL